MARVVAVCCTFTTGNARMLYGDEIDWFEIDVDDDDDGPFLR